MATVMLMNWPEASKEQYEEVRKEVNWEGEKPVGGKFHVAWFEADGLHVLDLWESQQDFEKFLGERLMPVVAKVGIQGRPKVRFAEAHAVYAPDV